MIRQASEKELSILARLEKECFKQFWDEEDLRREFTDNPFSSLFLLEEEGKACGYIIVWVTFENAQIARIGISPSKRKKGYGQKLLLHAMDYAREQEAEVMTLDVRAGNEAARKLYENAGFTILNRTPGYYPDGEDALLMGAGL